MIRAGVLFFGAFMKCRPARFKPDAHIHGLKMWTIAFRLEEGAAFQHDHADCQKQKKDAEPINFFHSRKPVYFYRGEYNLTVENQDSF